MDNKPDFSNAVSLFPHISREGLRFGSRLDVHLPKGASLEVRLGQIMVAGETVVGHLQ